jgi:Tfp pilus assembly protein PilF
LIAAHEQTLSAAPKNLASQLSLAYLLEATGETKRAQEMWANLNR